MTPWTAARQASLSFTISRSLLKFVSIELGMPSHRLTFCCSSPWAASILSRSLFLFALPASLARLFGPPPLVIFSSLGFLSFSVSCPLSRFWVSGWGGAPALGTGRLRHPLQLPQADLCSSRHLSAALGNAACFSGGRRGQWPPEAF